MLTRASITGISLRQRLLILTLLTSGIGLLLGCGANLFLELHNAKVKTVQDLRSTADLIGTAQSAPSIAESFGKHGNLHSESEP